MLAGKCLLDRALALAEPVDSGVEFVLIDGPETKNVAGLEAAVAGSSMRAVASLEAGAISRATIIAMTRSRGRLPAGPRMRSSPMARSVPSTAAT